MIDRERLWLIDNVAFAYARARRRLHELDDLRGVARLAYVEEIERNPAMADEPEGLIVTMLRRRLSDHMRRTYGRRTAHGVVADRNRQTRLVIADAHSLEALRDVGYDAPDPDDTAVAALDLVEHENAEQLISDICGSVPSYLRVTAEFICEGIAAGLTYQAIADLLQVTESRICQIVNEIGQYARRGRSAWLAS